VALARRTGLLRSYARGEIGRPLFDGVGKRVVLTESDELFVAFKSPGAEGNGLRPGRAARSVPSDDGTLRIGATHTFNLRPFRMRRRVSRPVPDVKTSVAELALAFKRRRHAEIYAGANPFTVPSPEERRARNRTTRRLDIRLHLHCLVLDGIYRLTEGGPLFQSARPPGRRNYTPCWQRSSGASCRCLRSPTIPFPTSLELPSGARSPRMADPQGQDSRRPDRLLLS
jgi:hypothetical protein